MDSDGGLWTVMEGDGRLMVEDVSLFFCDDAGRHDHDHGHGHVKSRSRHGNGTKTKDQL